MTGATTAASRAGDAPRGLARRPDAPQAVGGSPRDGPAESRRQERTAAARRGVGACRLLGRCSLLIGAPA
eukprot:6475128-Prymnesium_polylepis.1